MSIISNPHDKLFKSSLAQKAVAIDFFKAHLPDSILKKMDMSTLQLMHNSYITPELKELHSDIVYQCKIQEKDSYIPIILLVEHQSSADKQMAFRLLRYTINLMQAHINEGHDYLPLVLPLCLYHGDSSPYPYSTDIYDSFQDPDLAKNLMFKPFQLIDLTTRSLDELKHDGLAALMELLFKAHHINKFRSIIKFALKEGLFAKVDEHLPAGYFQNTLYYTASFDETDLTAEELLELLITDLPNKREQIMTFREQLQQEGIKQGMQQGMQKGMLLGAYQTKREDARKFLAKGVDRTIVKEVTGLSDTELDSL